MPLKFKLFLPKLPEDHPGITVPNIWVSNKRGLGGPKTAFAGQQNVLSLSNLIQKDVQTGNVIPLYHKISPLVIVGRAI